MWLFVHTFYNRTVQLLPINVTSSDVLTWKKICTTFYIHRGHMAVETVTVTAASESVVAKENLSVKGVLALYVRINNEVSFYKPPYTSGYSISVTEVDQCLKRGSIL